MNSSALKRITALFLTFTMLIGMVPSAMADVDPLYPAGNGGNLSPTPQPIFYSNSYPEESIPITNGGTYTFYVYVIYGKPGVQFDNNSALSLVNNTPTAVTGFAIGGGHDYDTYQLYMVTVKANNASGATALHIYSGVMNSSENGNGAINLSFKVEPKPLKLYKNNGQTDNDYKEIKSNSIVLPSYNDCSDVFGEEPVDRYFGGWNDKNDGTGTTYQAGDSFSFDEEEKSLYVKWNSAYYIKYYGYNESSSQYEIIKDTKIKSLPTFENAGLSSIPDGESFVGWSLLPDATIADAILPGASLDLSTKDPNITNDYDPLPIYAVWGITHKVTFNSNGGSGTMEPVTVIGTDYVLPECEFNKDGHTCDGWIVNGEKKTIGSTITINADIEIKASWEKNSTISFAGGSAASGSCDNISALPGSEISLPGAVFTRDGYKQVGWATKQVDDYGESATFIPVPADGLFAMGSDYTLGIDDTCLYAVWQKSNDYGFMIDGKHYYIQMGDSPLKLKAYTQGNMRLTSSDIVLQSQQVIDPSDYAGDSSVPLREFIFRPNTVGDTEAWIDYGALEDKKLDKYSCYIHVEPAGNRLIYDTNGGTGTVNRQYSEEGSTCKLQSGSSLVKDDKYFYGWSFNKDTEYSNVDEYYKAGDQYTFTGTDQVIYAVWGPSRKITYDLNGGEGSIPSTQYYSALDSSAEAYVATSEKISKDGKIFIGWSTEENPVLGTDKLYQPGDKITVTADTTTLYAVWGDAYTLTFDVNTLTNLSATTGPAPVSVRAGVNPPEWINLPSESTFKNALGDKYFIGWWLDASKAPDLTDSNDLKKILRPGTVFSVSSDIVTENKVTLYAIVSDKYSLTYSKNQMEGDVPAVVYGPSVENYKEVSLPEPVKLIPSSGNMFYGWSENAGATPGGTDKIYKPGDKYKIDGEKTLYAIQVPLLTLSFSLGDGITGTAPVSMTGSSVKADNRTVALPALARDVVTHANKVFAGWSVNPEDSTKPVYQPGDSFTINENITLKAVWKDAISVTYDNNGGAFNGKDPVVVFDGVTDDGKIRVKTAKADASWTPSKDNSTFYGWSTKSDTSYTNTSEYTAPGGVIELDPSVSNDVTLYAIWGPEKYTVIFDGNKVYKYTDTQTNPALEYPAPCNVPSMTVTVGEPFILPQNTTLRFTAEDGRVYEFYGWSRKQNADILLDQDQKDLAAVYGAGDLFYFEDDENNPGGSTTLYAIWHQVEGEFVGKIEIAIQMENTIPSEPAVYGAQYFYPPNIENANFLDYFTSFDTVTGFTEVQNHLKPAFWDYVESRIGQLIRDKKPTDADASNPEFIWPTYDYNPDKDTILFYVIKYQTKEANGPYADAPSFHVDGVLLRDNKCGLVYEPNGGAGKVPEGIVNISVGYVEKIKGNVTDTSVLYRSGYEFDGWSLYPDGHGLRYYENDSLAILKDIFNDENGRRIVHLYAQWKPKSDGENFYVSVNKVWMDNNNAYGVRPEYLNVKIRGFENGVEFSIDNATAQLIGPKWTQVFKVPKDPGLEGTIVYTIEEDELPDYEATFNGTNITNTYTNSPTKKVVFTKVWDDNSDQDNIRPDTIKVELWRYKSTQKISQATCYKTETFGENCTNTIINNDDTWTGTFGSLDKYVDTESDEEWNYFIKECAVEGYATTLSADGKTITNTIEGTTEVSGTKTWVDGGKSHNNGDEITLTLKRSVEGGAEETVTGVTVAWTNNTYKYSNLAKYDAEGYEYSYFVYEEKIEGYDSDKSGYNFTNTITGTTEVSGTKTWVDGGKSHNNGDEITLKLWQQSKKNGAEATTLTATITWDNETYTYTDLPMYDAEGYEYSYSVEEVKIPGYESEQDGNNFINTRVGKTSVTVVKHWDDADNQDGVRKQVEVELLANNTSTGMALTIDKTNAIETVTFDNIDAFDQNGIEISYSVEEASITGYEIVDYQISGNFEEGFTINITNKHEPAKTSVTVKKVWDDNDDQDGERTKLTLAVVKKTAAGTTEVVDSHTLTANELTAESFTYTFNNLPVNEAGKSIVYEAAEFDWPEGYTPGEWVKISNYEYKITNTHEPLTTDVTVTKIWDDDNNRDGKRQEVNVKLYADGKFTGFEEKLSTVNSNEVTFTGLLAYRDHGTPIQYSVVEETLNGYSSDYSDVTGDPENGYAVTITNKHGIEKTEITVTKVWEDNDDQDGLRGDYEVALFADGEEVSGTAVELSATELSHTWTELPVYNKGSVITYTVQEKTVPEEYSALVNGFTITNKHEPAKTSITVTKHWEDNNDLDKARKEVKITLLGDEKTIRTEVFTTDQDNTVTFADLDAYRDHGVEIIYTLAEEIIPGYTGEIGDLISDGNGGYTVTVTNKRGDVELTKEAAIEGGNAKAAAGDKILFTITVENTGALDLTDMKITDKRFTGENADVKIDGKAAGSELNGDTVNLDVVATGAEPIIITYYYTVTEADTLAGKVDNTANVTATADPKDSNVYDEGSTTTPTVEANGHLTYTKTEVSKPANGKAYAAGEQVTWTLKVENDGNLTIENVTVVDEKTKDNLSAGTLKPGEYKEFTSKPYTVTEQDVLNGEVYNVVTGKGDSPDPKEPNVPVTPGDDTVETVPAEPKLTVTKTSDKEGKRVAKGERITYKIVVKNEGNITLHNVEVNDELTGMKQKLDTLNVGASREFITRWIVTDKDVKAGSVLNSVTAEADPVPNPKDPDHPFTPSDEDDVTDKTKDPGISIEKTIPDKKAFYKKDEKIEYQIKITNTGDIELTNVILKDSLYKNVEDIKVNGTPTNLDGVMIRVGDLEAGETAIVTYVYPVTNNGNRTVENTAKVTAKDPDGVEVGDEDREDARIAKEDPVIHELIVHYWYEEIGGEVAAPDSVHYYYTGDNYNIKSPDIPGYDCDKPKLKGTMPDKDVEFNVIYTPIKHHLTIKYVDINGNELFKKYTDLLRTGDEYFVPSPVINGYTTQDILVTGIMPTHDKTITVVYVKPDTLTVINDFNVPRFGERIILNIGECYE